MTDQPQTSPQKRYSLEHLQNYIGLHNILTGEKLTKIEVTPDFYTWYVQETQRNAEILGLTPGFKDGKAMFYGVEIIKKVKIETT